MKSYLYLSLSLLILLGCTRNSYLAPAAVNRRSVPAASYSSQVDNSVNYRSSSGSNGAQILSVQLTPQYTILNVRFKNWIWRADATGRLCGPASYIYINPKAKLIAAGGRREFAFIKASGIPVLPKKLRVAPVDQVSFTLYFERLDKGLEVFDWGECAREDGDWCWWFFNLHVDNPVDTMSDTPQAVAANASVSGENELAAPKPLRVGDIKTLQTIYFDIATADLQPTAFAELDQLAALMLHSPQMTIRVAGYTDAIGDHQKNLRLSRDRANACQRYLIRKGIDSRRIQAVGYGDSRPIRTNGAADGRNVNRRVEFTILTL